MLTSQITARNFGPIGQIGETPGFMDFTAAQITQNGFAAVQTRTIEFDSATLFASITTESAGKLEVVNQTKIAVDNYIATVFDTVNSTVDAKIFINNVTFGTKASTGVIDYLSNYVPRELTTTVSYVLKVQVS